MKFAISAALLASVAVALPTGTLPISSGVVPSGLPTGIPTGVPSSLPAPGAGGAEKQVMTITNESKENVPVSLENNELTSILSKSGLLSSTESVGQVLSTADSVQELGADPSKGLIAVKTEGQYALVQVTGAVKILVEQLSSLPLLGQPLGTVTSTVQSALPIKRDAVNNVVMQVKDTASNKLIPFNLDQGVVEKLSVGNIGELQQGPVGTVLKTVNVEDVQSTVQNLAVDPTQVMSIATADRAQMILVKVEDKASGVTGLLGGLLSTLGLTPVTQAVGTVTQSAPIPL